MFQNRSGWAVLGRTETEQQNPRGGLQDLHHINQWLTGLDKTWKHLLRSLRSSTAPALWGRLCAASLPGERHIPAVDFSATCQTKLDQGSAAAIEHQDSCAGNGVCLHHLALGDFAPPGYLRGYLGPGYLFCDLGLGPWLKGRRTSPLRPLPVRNPLDDCLPRSDGRCVSISWERRSR